MIESESESILESRIENGSNDIEDYQMLGKIYFDRGSYDKLLKLLERALTLPLSNEERAAILHHKGQANDFLGKREDAISCYEKSLSLDTDEKDDVLLDCSAMNYYNLSVLLHNEEKGTDYAKRALKKFEALLQKYPDYEEKHMIYAHISELYRRFNEFDKAIDSCKKAIETANNDEERMGFLVGLGTIHRDKGNYCKSEGAFRQALILAKKKRWLSKIHFEYGKLYYESNQIQNAIEAFNNALKSIEYDPLLKNNKEYNIEIFWHLGSLYYNKKEYDRVIEYLDMTLEDIDENSAYYCSTNMTLGHCYLAKEEYDRARGYYDKALLSPLATKEDIGMANECIKRIKEEYRT